MTAPGRLNRRRLVLAAAAVPAAPLAAALVPALPAAASEPGSVRATPLVQGLERPWAFAFLPDGRLLVTEKAGRMRLVQPGGRLSAPLAGVPEVASGGQGGLLDVVPSPLFARDRTVFFSYADGKGWGSRTAVDRAVLGETGLTDVRRIFTQQPGVPGSLHFGSRLAFARDGRLFIVLGERYTEMRSAQALDNHLGKVVRIEPDGSVPADNPFRDGRDGALPEIWSYGHRNAQGAAIHPDTGELWMIEHGPRGGDELNVARAGRNYGWPAISYGVDYSGLPIAEGTEKPGMEQPLHQWTPSIAPSGMAFLTSDRYGDWRGSLFVGALKFRLLVRLALDGERVVREQRMLESLGARIRDVRQGPDGLLYVATDAADGQILRVDPA